MPSGTNFCVIRRYWALLGILIGLWGTIIIGPWAAFEEALLALFAVMGALWDQLLRYSALLGVIGHMNWVVGNNNRALGCF